MKKIQTLFVLSLTLCLLMSTTCLAEEFMKLGFAKETAEEYSYKKKYKYLLQVPLTQLDDSAPIMIYVHGAGGKQEEGMKHRPLRKIMNDWGWIYVSPRDYEFKGLVAHLNEKFGKRKIFLMGLSRGGYHTYHEAKKHPAPYTGLILLCPAMRSPGYVGKMAFPMPVYIICGENDKIIVKSCRKLNKRLLELKRKVLYRELPNEGHGAPSRMIVWEDAIRFVGGEPVKKMDAKPETKKPEEKKVKE